MKKQHRLIGKYVRFNAESLHFYNMVGLIISCENEHSYRPFAVLIENGETRFFDTIHFDIIKTNEKPEHLTFIKSITKEMGGVINWKLKKLFVGCQTIHFKKVHQLSNLIASKK